MTATFCYAEAFDEELFALDLVGCHDVEFDPFETSLVEYDIALE